MYKNLLNFKLNYNIDESDDENQKSKYTYDDIIDQWTTGFRKLKCDFCTSYIDKTVICENCQSRTNPKQKWRQYEMKMSEFVSLWGNRLYHGKIFKFILNI